MLKSKNKVTLFVKYSTGMYSKQKFMCQNMGFLILYGSYICTYL